MAVHIESWGTLGEGPSTSTSPTTVTAGLPSGLQAGDLMIVLCSYMRAGVGLSTITITEPSGEWTAESSIGETGTAPGQSIRIFWKFWEPGDTAPDIVFTGGTTGASGNAPEVMIGRVSGAHATTPFAPSPSGVGSVSGGGSTAVAPPAPATIPQPGDLLLAYGARTSAAGSFTSITTNWNLEFDEITASGADGRMMAGSRLASGANMGTCTFTYSTSVVRVGRQHIIQSIPDDYSIVPSIRSASAAEGVSSGGTTVTIPKPTGVANGDLLIAHIDGRGTATITCTPPAGWTQSMSPQARSTSGREFIYHKVISDAGSEPSDYTFTISTSSTHIGDITCIQNADTSDPINATASGTQSGQSSCQCPSITTDVDGTLILRHVLGAFGDEITAGSFTWPSEWAHEITDHQLGGSGGFDNSQAFASTAWELGPETAGADTVRVAICNLAITYAASTVAINPGVIGGAVRKTRINIGGISSDKPVFTNVGGVAVETPVTAF